MKVGDYVKMRGDDGVLYGEVVGITDTELEVYFIERGDDNTWSYSDEWHKCLKNPY